MAVVACQRARQKTRRMRITLPAGSRFTVTTTRQRIVSGLLALLLYVRSTSTFVAHACGGLQCRAAKLHEHFSRASLSQKTEFSQHLQNDSVIATREGVT